LIPQIRHYRRGREEDRAARQLKKNALARSCVLENVGLAMQPALDDITEQFKLTEATKSLMITE
jgi:hypothetical protein